MKKILTGILVLSMIMGILCGCKKQPPLPIPEYPLNADTIAEALRECDLPYTIQEEDWARQGQSRYNLYMPENDKFFVCGILNGQQDGERFISIIFPPFYSPNSLPAKESENVIAFATLLYGGFENSRQVYDNFTRDYDTINTERVQNKISDSSSTPSSEGSSRWESNIGGTTCQITLEQPTLSEAQEYLRVIMLTSNLDTFNSD